MPVVLSPLGGAGAQFLDDDGIPLSGGKLHTYAAGTDTPQTTYTTSAGNVAHTNPIVLDSAGRVPGGQVWFTVGVNYKVIATDSVDVTVSTWDNIESPGASGVPFTAPPNLGFGATTATVEEGLTDLATNITTTTPAGSIVMYGGSTAPTGWLICDGSVKAAATYPNLFAAIGSTFNTSGEGTGNFRLPDLRGRAPIGVGTGTGLTARTLGATGGTETHNLTINEMPAHYHAIIDPGHSHSENVVGDSVTELTEAAPDALAPFLPTNVASTTGSSTTGISATESTGASTAHPNMQPFLAINFIIRT